MLSADLLDRIRAAAHDAVPDPAEVQEKGIVGGAGLMWRGNLLCGVVSGDLVVRVGKAGFEDAVARPGAGPMAMAGRASSAWVSVDAAQLTDDTTLREWIGRGVSFVATLPRK
jgi:TfoX/Sxy family transcriptional regulator of competence genes